MLFRSPAAPPEPAPPERTFTQADVDRIIGETRAQRRGEVAEENTQLRDQLAAATARADRVLQTNALVQEATRQGAISASAIAALADRSQLTIGDDDQVSGAEEAVKAVLEREPALVGQAPAPTPEPTPTPRPTPVPGGPRPAPTGKSLAEQIAEAEAGGNWTELQRLNGLKLAQVKAPAA